MTAAATATATITAKEFEIGFESVEAFNFNNSNDQGALFKSSKNMTCSNWLAGASEIVPDIEREANPKASINQKSKPRSKE